MIAKKIKKENKIYLFLVLMLLLAIIIVVFAVQNNKEVTVSLLSLKFESTMAIIIIISFFVGTITAILFMLPYLMQSNKKIKNLNQKLLKNRNQVDQDSSRSATLNEEETETE